jgi:hypothetical protein
MATRSENFRAEEQRKGPRAADGGARSTQKATASQEHAKTHAEKKASYARELPAEGSQPSRKSTRKSANRSKPDTNLILRESRKNRSPEARFRKSAAQSKRVRGKRPTA